MAIWKRRATLAWIPTPTTQVITTIPNMPVTCLTPTITTATRTAMRGVMSLWTGASISFVTRTQRKRRRLSARAALMVPVLVIVCVITRPRADSSTVQSLETRFSSAHPLMWSIPALSTRWMIPKCTPLRATPPVHPVW